MPESLPCEPIRFIWLIGPSAVGKLTLCYELGRRHPEYGVFTCYDPEHIRWAYKQTNIIKWQFEHSDARPGKLSHFEELVHTFDRMGCQVIYHLLFCWVPREVQAQRFASKFPHASPWRGTSLELTRYWTCILNCIRKHDLALQDTPGWCGYTYSAWRTDGMQRQVEPRELPRALRVLWSPLIPRLGLKKSEKVGDRRRRRSVHTGSGRS